MIARKRWFIALSGLFAIAFCLIRICYGSEAKDDQIERKPRVSATNGSELIDPNMERIGVTDSEILLGSCLPLSGKLAERGKQVTIGANCYLNYLNDQGGVNKRTIKLHVCDDGYDPAKAIGCFNNCLKDKVFAGAFFAGSAPITKYVRMGDVNRTPMLGYCTGTPLLYDFHPTQFVVRASYADEARAQVAELAKARGFKRFGIVYQNDAMGASIRTNFTSELQKAGLRPVVESSYMRTVSDASAAIDAVRAADPEVVILAGTSDALLSMVKKRHEEHMNSLFVAYSVAADYLQELGKEADGIMLTQVVPPMDEHLASVALYNKLRKHYFPDAQPNVTSFEAYLNAMVVAEGLKRAGRDLTRTKFIRALEAMKNLDLGCGPTFKVSFSPTSHCGLGNNSIYFAIVRNGQFSAMTVADWKALAKK